MDMKAVYGKDFLSGADLTTVSDSQFGKIRAACADPYEQAGGKPGSARRLAFRFYPESKTTKAPLPIICTVSTKAQPKKGRAPTFSAF